MNPGILSKTWREIWLATLLFLLAFAGFQILLLRIYPEIFSNYQELFQAGFMKNIFKAVLGAEVSEKIGPELPKALMWAHPLIIALLFAHAIMLFTRIPAGEVGSGTIDILLSWPVSRKNIFLTNAFVCLLAGLAIIFAGFLSHLIFSRFAPPDYRIPPGTLAMIAFNMFCLYIAVTGIINWVTSLCSQRAKSVGISFAILISFDLIDYVSEFWAPAKNLSYITIWHYYQPLDILNSHSFPLLNISILLALGIISYVLSLTSFSKRNICTT